MNEWMNEWYMNEWNINLNFLWLYVTKNLHLRTIFRSFPSDSGYFAHWIPERILLYMEEEPDESSMSSCFVYLRRPKPNLDEISIRLLSGTEMSNWYGSQLTYIATDGEGG